MLLSTVAFLIPTNAMLLPRLSYGGNNRRSRPDTGSTDIMRPYAPTADNSMSLNPAGELEGLARTEEDSRDTICLDEILKQSKKRLVEVLWLCHVNKTTDAANLMLQFLGWIVRMLSTLVYPNLRS